MYDPVDPPDTGEEFEDLIDDQVNGDSDDDSSSEEDSDDTDGDDEE